MKFIITLLLIFCCLSSTVYHHDTVRLCTEMYSDRSQKKGYGILAAGPKTFLWPHNTDSPLILYVKFLGGSSFQKSKVIEYSRYWTRASDNKIIFKFEGYDRPFRTPNIRIGFNSDLGSYSYIGNDAIHTPPHKETMNLGWINQNEPEESIKQVILHEFGHAIVLIHEHLHPEVTIPWNKPAVYQYYHKNQKPPWDRTKVDSNIFQRYEASSLNYSEYDSKSIMHYHIPNILTEGDFEIPWNMDLSPADINFAKKMYP